MKGDYDFYKTRVIMTAFNRLKEEHPELINRIGFWNYRKIMTEFNELMLEEVFNNVQGFELPFSFGRLIMVGFKIKKKTPYVEHSKKHLHLSRTENYVYRLVWLLHQDSAHIPHVEFWNFRTEKLVAGKIVKRIKEDRFFHWIKMNSTKDIIKYEARDRTLRKKRNDNR